MEKYTIVGYTIKPHGVKGELKIKTEQAYEKSVLKAKALFFEQGGKYFPYFIQQLRLGNSAILKLEGVDNKEGAQRLSKCSFALQTSDIEVNESPLEMDPHEFFKTFTNYTIVDKAVGRVGVIESVIEMPQQSLAILEYNGNEVMIPLNDQFIDSIDQENQVLSMDLPEGILEL